MQQRAQIKHLAVELVRRAKNTNVDPITGQWEAPLHGEKGADGVSLMNFLLSRHQNTVHRMLEILVSQED